MAAPSASGHVTSESDSFATTFAVTMPATVDAGDLLFILVQNCTNNNAINTPADWTAIFSDTTDTSASFALFYKVADGSEDGATVNVTKVGGVGCRFVAQAWRVTGKTFVLADVEWASVVPGSNDDPDPPSVTPSWSGFDTLFIAAVGIETSTGTPTAPSGYGSVHDSVNAGDGRVMTAELAELNNSGAAQNPGVFTLVAGSSDGWATTTLAIKGDAAVASITIGPVAISYSVPALTPTQGILRSLSPVDIAYSVPALGVSASIARSLTPVVISHTTPTLTVTKPRLLAPVVVDFSVPALTRTLEVTMPPVAINYDIQGLSFRPEGVPMDPVLVEFTIPALAEDHTPARSLSPVPIIFSIPALGSDYDQARTLSPVQIIYSVPALNRRQFPAVIRLTQLYPSCFIHYPWEPRHQVAYLGSAFDIDYAFVGVSGASQSGRTIGQASITIKSSDPALALSPSDLLQGGYFLAIEAPNLPAWAGPILDLEEDSQARTLRLGAASVEILLDGRPTPQEVQYRTPIGEDLLFRTLLDHANSRSAHTGIEFSTSPSAGHMVDAITLGGLPTLRAFNDIISRTNSEYWFSVHRTSSSLRFVLHLAQFEGADISGPIHFYEGKHFTGTYISDMTQLWESVTTFADFGWDLPDRRAFSQFVDVPGIGFGPNSSGAPAPVAVRRAIRALPSTLRNERVNFDLMAETPGDLAALNSHTQERPLFAAERFIDDFNRSADWDHLRIGNRWTRHGSHKGLAMDRVVRIVGLQPDGNDLVRVISEAVY